MNWLNSRSKGYKLNLSKIDAKEQYPRQVESLRTLRKIYFPKLHFENCQFFFRGILIDLPSTLQGSGDQAVVVMWRKQQKTKTHTNKDKQTQKTTI